VNIISKDWRAFRGHCSPDTSRACQDIFFLNNERHKISSVNLLGVLGKIKTRYFCIPFWITTTTPSYKIIKYVLISQNTTILAKVVHGISTVSTVSMYHFC